MFINQYSFKTTEVINETNCPMKTLIRIPFERLMLLRQINSLLYKLQLKNNVNLIDETKTSKQRHGLQHCEAERL